MSNSLNVYIVDDDEDVCQSLRLYLSTIGYVSQTFSDGSDFIHECDDLAPGCVLLDVRMPNLDAFGVLKSIGRVKDQFCFVVMTGHGDVATAVAAMRAGAVDFLEKPFEEELITRALARANERLAFQITDYERRLAALGRLQSLSSREREVLKGLIEGRSNKLLAHEMGISVRTVEMHRANMMERLEARSSAQVIRLAYDAGMIDRRSREPTGVNGTYNPAVQALAGS